MNPYLKELIEIQNSYKGSTRLTFPGCTREYIKNNFNKALQEAKKRMASIEQQELDEQFLSLQGWMKVTDLQKDGNLYLLLVRTSNVNNPTEDNDYHRTIGFNSLDDTGEDKWFTAGWCWSHDNFTHNETLEGVLYYQELPAILQDR